MKELRESELEQDELLSNLLLPSGQSPNTLLHDIWFDKEIDNGEAKKSFGKKWSSIKLGPEEE